MRNGGLERFSALGSAARQAPVPLVDRPGLRVVEEPLLAVTGLRQSRVQATDIAGALGAAGLAPPDRPNRFSGNDALSCAWVEPRAWLVLDARDGSRAAPAVTSHPLLVTELSDRFASFRLSGARAAELLAAGTPVSLEAGACARTRFAEEVDVFIQRFTGETGYRLLIDAGFAHYAADWLRDAVELLLAGAKAAP